MSFFNRFLIFCFGIFLGLLILFVSFQARKDSLNFNYFPSSRIKNYLIQNKIVFSQKSVCKMHCLNLDTALLNSYIKNSDIDFKKSQIRGYANKVYYLDFSLLKKNSKNSSFLKFEIHNDSITLVDVFINFGIPFNQAPGHLGILKCEHCY